MGVGLTAGLVPELVVGQPELLDAEKDAMKDAVVALHDAFELEEI